jgi:hypothetical protein
MVEPNFAPRKFQSRGDAINTIYLDWKYFPTRCANMEGNGVGFLHGKECIPSCKGALYHLEGGKFSMLGRHAYLARHIELTNGKCG